MELALIRSLMTKDFYDNHRGAKCPDRLFSKDVRKIKSTLDKAMRTYERDVTPDEIEALFISGNPTLTTAQKQAYESAFINLKKDSILIIASALAFLTCKRLPEAGDTLMPTSPDEFM